MRYDKLPVLETALRQGREASLDLAVPFTTPELTAAALNAAGRLGAGLHVAIRLLKIHIVPYPLDLAEPPVAMDFLAEQLRRFPSIQPIHREIRIARDFEPGLRGAIEKNSIVILATRKWPWRTSTERLAAHLRRDGYTVVLVPACAAKAPIHNPCQSPVLNPAMDILSSQRTNHA